MIHHKDHAGSRRDDIRVHSLDASEEETKCGAECGEDKSERKRSLSAKDQIGKSELFYPGLHRRVLMRLARLAADYADDADLLREFFVLGVVPGSSFFGAFGVFRVIRACDFLSTARFEAAH